jgi:hypothetical protein
VPSAQRQSIDDTATTSDYTGTATNDLIDADGSRVIEVGRLTLRVRSTLQTAGSRPRPGADKAVTIEHADGGASIVIDQNGGITITCKKLDIDAGTGDITMKAANVKVQVSGTMDVSPHS